LEAIVTTETRPQTKWSYAVLFGALGALAVALVVLAFLWPIKTASAHDLPVSLAGPKASVTALTGAVDKAAPGTFDFVSATGRADAVAQIKHRDTYGAIVLGAPGTAPEVLTAPAASPVAAELLTGVAAKLQAQLTRQAAAAGSAAAAPTVSVTPVVPLAASDPAGGGLATATFPLMIGGLLGGVLVSLLVVGALRRLVALAGFAVATGLVLALVLQTWFDYLQGSFWLNTLGIGLTVVATSAFVAGCASLLGNRGIAIGAVITVLLGAPLSAAAAPWQFFVAPWGVIGQFLVPGAGNALLRTLSYFPDANTAPQWLILSGWTALGVVLVIAGPYRARAGAHVPAESLDREELVPVAA
jgi:hypothetical protein